MITRPTVLILGAGASQPYGFSVGTGLRDKIHIEAASRREYYSRNFNLDQNILMELAIEIRDARPASIDLFLERDKAT